MHKYDEPNSDLEGERQFRFTIASVIYRLISHGIGNDQRIYDVKTNRKQKKKEKDVPKIGSRIKNVSSFFWQEKNVSLLWS